MLIPLIWGGVGTPAGYQEAETVNQLLTSAQQINEASWRAWEVEKVLNTPTFVVHLILDFSKVQFHVKF